MDNGSGFNWEVCGANSNPCPLLGPLSYMGASLFTLKHLHAFACVDRWSFINELGPRH